MILRDRVVRMRASLVDGDYGNRERDWPNADAITYPATITPVTTDENVVDQQRATSRWRMFLPASADVEATDRIWWDGDTYDIDGDVQTFKRRGRPHHHEALLIKVTQG